MQCKSFAAIILMGPQLRSQATKDVKEGACVSSLYLSITTFADLEMISLNYVNQSFANRASPI